MFFRQHYSYCHSSDQHIPISAFSDNTVSKTTACCPHHHCSLFPLHTDTVTFLLLAIINNIAISVTDMASFTTLVTVSPSQLLSQSLPVPPAHVTLSSPFKMDMVIHFELPFSLSISPSLSKSFGYCLSFRCMLMGLLLCALCISPACLHHHNIHYHY